MTRRDSLRGHTFRYGRRDLGAGRHGGHHRFATTSGCSCGWEGSEIQQAPTAGGRDKAVLDHRDHVADVISRDAVQAAVRARTSWRKWQPGDGSCYQIRILAILEGPDFSDRVLLVNISRKTWSFQYPTAGYRMMEMGSVDYRRSFFQGQAGDVWAAVEPLLVAEGVIDDQ